MARFRIRERRFADVRWLPIRDAREAAPEMGEEAKERQVVLPCVQGSAAMGRHHVYPDQYHEYGESPPKAGMGDRIEFIGRLFVLWIHLGTVYLAFERRAPWV
jgi:hypothetical protein